MVGDLKVAELKIILTPLRITEDWAISKHKKDLLDKLMACQGGVAAIVLEVFKEEAAEFIDEV